VRAASETVAWISLRKAQGAYACVVGRRGWYQSPRGVVVGLPAQEGQRYRWGRISTQTDTSKRGRWRRRTAVSHPCRARIARPQRRHWAPATVLSTQMRQCPGSRLCVERTRTSGTCSGTCMQVSLATPPVNLCLDHLTRTLPRSTTSCGPPQEFWESPNTPPIAPTAGLPRSTSCPIRS
jgi:hypothetical protein